jgi:hypothetical protein
VFIKSGKLNVSDMDYIVIKMLELMEEKENIVFPRLISMKRFITSDKRNTLNNTNEEKSECRTICAGVRERLDKELGNKRKKSVKQKKKKEHTHK